MIEHQGKLYARVSDIIRPFVNFEGISEEVLNKKAAIGTRVHDAIDQEIKGYFPILVPNEVGYLKSFNKWRAVLSPVFLETEMRYYCDKKMITGRIDSLIKLQGEEETILVDFKTAVQESPTWVMQAHLYYYLLSVQDHLRDYLSLSPRFLFIKLDKWGGFPRVYQYKFDGNVMRRCYQAIDDFWEKKDIAVN